MDRVLLASPRGFCAGRGEGHQGARLDGDGLRAARLLLPRDRPQPTRRRPLLRARGRLRRRRRRGAGGRTAHAERPRLAARGRGGRPGPRRRRRRRGLPPRDQGPPRAQGPRVQGLHGAVRRATRATRRRSGRWRSRRRSVRLIESTEDLDAVPADGAPVALLSQTTLSFDEWQHLRSHAEARFPELWMPNRSDLCFATTNRQSALREIAAVADAVVVIGSANSSNTVALDGGRERVGLSAGAARQHGRRAARRPLRRRRGDRGSVGARRARRRGDRARSPRPVASRAWS